MAKTVIGLVDNIGEAQNVVRDLVESGIKRDDIGFMANEKHATPTRAETRGAERGGDAASGALAGAGTGAAVGGVAGLALALAPLAIPGIGPIVAAGPIAAALTGAGIGAVAGGLIGGLTRLGVPEDEAHYYAEGVRRGGILITVAADSDREANMAVEILKRHGAVDIDERAAEWKKQGWKGRFDADATSPASSSQGERSIPVTEVELAAGKRQVERRPVDRLVKVGKKREKKSRTVQDTVRRTDVDIEGASNPSRYTGPERRMSRLPYSGTDRRRAA